MKCTSCYLQLVALNRFMMQCARRNGARSLATCERNIDGERDSLPIRIRQRVCNGCYSRRLAVRTECPTETSVGTIHGAVQWNAVYHAARNKSQNVDVSHSSFGYAQTL